MRFASVALAVVLVPVAARADDAPTPPPVVIVTPPPPEPAPPEDAPGGEVAAPPALAPFGLEIMLGASMFAPRLEGMHFSGSGTIGGQAASFEHRGAEMGLRAPHFYGFELGVAYQRRYFSVGLVGGIAFARADSGTQLAGVYDPTSLRAYWGGLDLAGTIPLGDFSLRIGPVVGIRTFDADLSGFDPTTCSGDGGTFYGCPETADTRVVPFLQPRARLDWTPGGADGIAVAGFASVDVLDQPTVGGGVLVGFHWAPESLAP